MSNERRNGVGCPPGETEVVDDGSRVTGVAVPLVHQPPSLTVHRGVVVGGLVGFVAGVAFTLWIASCMTKKH